MADIIGFPQQAGPTRLPDSATGQSDAAARRDSTSQPPAQFLEQIDAIRLMDVFRSVTYREIPAAPKLADFGLGVEFTLTAPGTTRPWPAGSQGGQADGLPVAARPANLFGWLTAHFSRLPRADWGSQWRLVAFLHQSGVDPSEAPFLPQLYGDLVQAVITPLAVEAPNGAVSLSCDQFFGPGQDPSDQAAPVTSCDIRASWSPAGADVTTHINAWAELMLKVAGEPVIRVPQPTRDRGAGRSGRLPVEGAGRAGDTAATPAVTPVTGVTGSDRLAGWAAAGAAPEVVGRTGGEAVVRG